MTLVIAYFVVWLGVVLYVARLAVRQRRLERALEMLEEKAESACRPTTARAA